VAPGKTSDLNLRRSVAEQGMKAQAALLPYALPRSASACRCLSGWRAHATNAPWMSASFAAFAIGWAAFYGTVGWLRDHAASNLSRRARVQLLGGLIWAATMVQLAVFAHYSGPVRETLLLVVLAAAMACVVFTAPWLPSLLVVAPIAVAAPLIALFIGAEDYWIARAALAGAALCLPSRF